MGNPRIPSQVLSYEKHSVQQRYHLYLLGAYQLEIYDPVQGVKRDSQ